MENKTNAPYAVASMVLGICSIVFGCIFIGLICGIIGLVLAVKGQNLYRQNPEKYSGTGMLTAGKVCSIIGIVLSALYILYTVVVMSIAGTMVGGIAGLSELAELGL